MYLNLAIVCDVYSLKLLEFISFDKFGERCTAKRQQITRCLSFKIELQLSSYYQTPQALH